MADELLLGIWRYLVPVPGVIWQQQVKGNARRGRAELSFMSAEHHLVRDFVVRELPHTGKALDPQTIAQGVGLAQERVVSILDDLESHMTFLFRNEQSAVAWAYPVTVDPTPHRVTFSSGEKLYAA